MELARSFFESGDVFWGGFVVCFDDLGIRNYHELLINGGIGTWDG